MGPHHTLSVMRGLDPRIHDERQRTRTYVQFHPLKRFMDCRVKPGNDRGEVVLFGAAPGTHQTRAPDAVQHASGAPQIRGRYAMRS
jgi:hypothetical protein